MRNMKPRGALVNIKELVDKKYEDSNQIIGILEERAKNYGPCDLCIDSIPLNLASVERYDVYLKIKGVKDSALVAIVDKRKRGNDWILRKKLI